MCCRSVANSHLQGCALFHSWWPLLACFAYILVPMPYLFFNQRGSYDVFDNNSMQAWWVDIGKFMTGFSAIALVAIPAVLRHAEMISTGALVMELAAALLLLAAVVVYDFQSS